MYCNALNRPRLERGGFILALLVAATLLLPHPGRGQQMVGTEYYACADQAEINDGICYLNADGYWDKVRCNIEYLTNIAGCATQLTIALTGIPNLIK